jgi:uncharacterized protein
MARRPIRIAAAVLLTLATATLVVGAGGAYGYASLAVEAGCQHSPYAAYTPSTFTVPAAEGTAAVDAGPYRFNDASDVAFPPRGAPLTLRAWYAPPARPDDPVVILSHGVHSCRRDPLTLLPAGMLHRAGFGVLVVDLRNHGDSDHDTGRTTLGAKESDDLLGAWDWLVAQGHDPARIGLFGTSLSAASAIDALGAEPRLAAVWSDSAFASVDAMLAELVAQRGFPAPLSAAIVPMGRLMGEATLGTRSPDRALAGLAGRPLALVHGAADGLVNVHHAADLAAAAAASGTPVAPWIVSGADHQQAVLREPAVYGSRLVAFFGGALGAP